MGGYSWISIIALCCYLFLFMTFLAARKNKKVIRTFLFLQVIMLLWTGGSFAMRSQLWPSVNFWHFVSIAGILLLPYGFYRFILDFLEEKKSFGRRFWLIVFILIFVVNLFTGFFIPIPEVIRTGGEVQFVYNYSWPIYIIFALVVVILIQLLFLVYRYCKGNRRILQQLLPMLVGISIVIIGHVASAIPMFKGIPLDIVSGVINAFLMFYGLYRKRLFRMTLLISRGNCYALSLIVSVALFSGCVVPLQRFLAESFNLGVRESVVVLAVILLCMTVFLYNVMKKFLDELFVRDEQIQSERISEFSHAVSRTLDMKEILQALVEVIQNGIKVQKMFICIKDEHQNYPVMYTGSPLDEKGFELDANHPIVHCLKQEKGSLLMKDFLRTTSYRSMWEEEKNLLKVWGIECFVPLMAEEELLGIVMLSKKEKKGSYHTEDLAFLQSVVSVCAMAVKNAILYTKAYEEARKDELTGLLNRKCFYEVLQKEFEQSKDTSLVLIILNVDDFKLYNQLYGSKEGDIALKRIAEIITATIGDLGYGARISGKEFAILLPGYDIYSGKVLAENVCSQVKEMNHRQKDYNLKALTISAGVCAYPYMASSPKELLDNTDMAVYSVKRSGKNAVLMYSEEIEAREESRKKKHKSGYSTYASTIYALTAAIDTKDHYTFKHSQNVAYYASELAKAYGMNQDLVGIVKEAGLLHDIGKIGIREDILNKSGKLTEEEFEIMKTHVENSIGIIRYLPSLDYVIPAVLSHHERFDGKGYPRKLAGNDIPIMGRMLCIADSFDAMTSERSYKKPRSVEESLAELERGAGSQFDPELVPIFIELIISGKIELQMQNEN